MIIPGVGLLEMRPPETAGVGVSPTPAMGEPGIAAGSDPRSDPPQFVQKRVLSSFGWAQAEHDLMGSGAV
jgi:hypothetical protein